MYSFIQVISKLVSYVIQMIGHNRYIQIDPQTLIDSMNLRSTPSTCDLQQ